MASRETGKDRFPRNDEHTLTRHQTSHTKLRQISIVTDGYLFEIKGRIAPRKRRILPFQLSDALFQEKKTSKYLRLFHLPQNGQTS